MSSVWQWTIPLTSDNQLRSHFCAATTFFGSKWHGAPTQIHVEGPEEIPCFLTQPPRQDQLHCQLTGYEVHLRKTGDSEDLARVQNLEAEAQSAKFNKLEPHMSYSVNVYPVTFLGRAPFNSSVEARTEQGGRWFRQAKHEFRGRLTQDTQFC